MKRAAALVPLVVLAPSFACKKPPHDSPTSIADASPKESEGAPPGVRVTTNLLVTTAAEVTVSSRVDNPRDFPEHLVDGKHETAWNGKTGDLSAWIEVKL